MTSRIYAVQGPDAFRLIEAPNKAAALRYVARNILTVTVASQRDLVNAMQDGIKIEQASKEPATAAE